MWLCSKQSSFFPFMHCPLVANRKTWWSITIVLGKMFIRLNTVHFFYQQKRNFLSSSVTCFGEISPFGQNPSSWQILYPAGHNFFDVKGPFLKNILTIWSLCQNLTYLLKMLVILTQYQLYSYDLSNWVGLGTSTYRHIAYAQFSDKSKVVKNGFFASKINVSSLLRKLPKTKF